METEETKQDTSSEKDKAPASNVGTTTPETYTKEQVEKFKLDAKSALGRASEAEIKATKLADSLALTEQRRRDAEASIVQLQKEKDEAELAGVRDNPDALSIYQTKQAQRAEKEQLRREREGLKAERLEQKEEVEALKEFRKEKLAGKIASEYEGIDASTLLSLTDGTPEKMKSLAERLGNPKASEPSIKPDSGATIGGTLSWDKVQRLYADNPYDPTIQQEYLRQRRERGG